MITVLVVEDDEKLNYIVSAKLEEQGYRVRHCGNPMEAFDVMDQEKVDLIGLRHHDAGDGRI